MSKLLRTHGRIRRGAVAIMTAVTLSASVGVAGPAIAPDIAAQAHAQFVNGSWTTATPEEVRNAYERLSKGAEDQVRSSNRVYTYANETLLLPSPIALGWCIDMGLNGPWNLKGEYLPRKLTGYSGLHGEGLKIDEDVRIAASNRGCPILCVRGLGLQVVRESVGVSHG